MGSKDKKEKKSKDKKSKDEGGSGSSACSTAAAAGAAAGALVGAAAAAAQQAANFQQQQQQQQFSPQFPSLPPYLMQQLMAQQPLSPPPQTTAPPPQPTMLPPQPTMLPPQPTMLPPQPTMLPPQPTMLPPPPMLQYPALSQAPPAAATLYQPPAPAPSPHQNVIASSAAPPAMAQLTASAYPPNQPFSSSPFSAPPPAPSLLQPPQWQQLPQSATTAPTAPLPPHQFPLQPQPQLPPQLPPQQLPQSQPPTLAPLQQPWEETRGIEEVVGSAALYDDYRRCLTSLEEVIKGGLQAKKEKLAASARTIEGNMEAVQQAAAAVEQETESDVAAIRERLERAKRNKLALLQHDLSSHLVDIELIDGFVDDVVASVDASESRTSVAENALQLLHQQPEMMRRAGRLLQKPLPEARRQVTDDFPRETAERARRLEHADNLDRLLRVKDAMLWSMLHDAQAKEASHSEKEVQLEQAAAYAQAVQSGSQQELLKWSELADEYQQQVQGLTGQLAESQQESATLRTYNEQLRVHNDQLRDHCERLRAELMARQQRP